MLKLMHRSIVIAAACLLWLSWGDPVHATGCGGGSGTCFEIGSGTNWNAAGTWSDSDGGASCACTPATGDSIFLTANSHNSTINAAFSILNFDATGFGSTLTHGLGVNLTLTGTTFKWPASGATYTAGSTSTSCIVFTGSGTLAFTTGNANFGCVTVNGTGTFQLQDTLKVQASATASILTLTQGTFDAATVGGVNVNFAQWSSSNSNTRQIKFGSGTWTSGALVPWTMTTITNATLTPGAATLAFTANGSRTLTSGACPGSCAAGSYPTISIGAQSAGTTTVNLDNSTVAGFAITSLATVIFQGSKTLTITAPIAWNASSGTPMGLNGANGTPATLSLSGGGTISWASIKDLTFSGTAPAISNSFNLGDNSGATINAPSGGGGQCIGC